MVRVNIVPPDELMDQHLIAEYREIYMIPSYLLKSGKVKIPSKYCLGTGHIKFFYNKILYLENRYKQLIEEMKSRGFKPNPNRIFPNNIPKEYYNDWKPNEEDFIIIRQRIAEKIAIKPTWYRKTSKK